MSPVARRRLRRGVLTRKNPSSINTEASRGALGLSGPRSLAPSRGQRRKGIDGPARHSHESGKIRRDAPGSSASPAARPDSDAPVHSVNGDARLKGVLITAAGVLALSPDGLLIRLIAADDWTLLFWRGLLSGLAIFAALAIIHRGALPGKIRAIGATGLWLVFFFTVVSVLFILSITLTTVANTLFITNTAPLFAALISHFVLREHVSRVTWAAIGFALVGIGLIASESVARGGDSVLGDVVALGAALAMAVTVVLARKGRARSMVAAVGLAGLMTAAVALPFAAPLSIGSENALYVALMGLVVLPLGFGLVTLGPRYLPAPQVSLLLLGEAIIGPLLVWLALGESPGALGLAGGAVVLASLACANLQPPPARRKAVEQGPATRPE